MDLGLKGKRALVLGGSRGIGRGIASSLSQEGALVAIVSRNIAALRSATEEISSNTGEQVIAVEGDLADPASMKNAVSGVQEQFGGVDILVNNSGGPPPTGASGVSAQQWRAEFEQMVLSIIGLTDLVLPAMRAAKWGRIITVASSGVIEPHALIGISNTLRSALVGWSKTLASEVARDRVTVNILLPGWIASERLRQIDEAKARIANESVDVTIMDNISRIPFGRYGTVEEFGAVAAFIASERASYVTGSMIRIDGGAIRSV
jgi:3-oxoacyl-[acyl-carrier protein] reductase